MRELRQFVDGTQLVYDDGEYDGWRVSFYDNDKFVWSPTDEELFSELLSFGQEHNDLFYAILAVADQIGPRTDFAQVRIETIDGTLKEEKMYSALAAMMIAEERKKSTQLGKKVKLLGLFQLLLEGFTPYKAAHWSRGRSTEEIRRRYENAELIFRPQQLDLLD